MRSVAAVLAVVVAACAWSGSALAITPGAQLDQSQGMIEGNADIVPGIIIGQTFTAGISGQLTEISITLANPFAATSPLHAVLTGVDGAGQPDLATATASLDLQPSDIPGAPTLVELHFAGSPSVAAGQTYAIVLSTTDVAGYQIFGAGSIPFYTAGEAWGSFDGGLSWSDVGGDADFATYVLPPAARAGYCLAGRFLDLAAGQPDTDPTYKGATLAIFVKGTGITCDPPPAGYSLVGRTTDADNVGVGTYALYAPTA